MQSNMERPDPHRGPSGRRRQRAVAVRPWRSLASPPRSSSRRSCRPWRALPAPTPGSGLREWPTPSRRPRWPHARPDALVVPGAACRRPRRGYGAAVPIALLVIALAWGGVDGVRRVLPVTFHGTSASCPVWRAVAHGQHLRLSGGLATAVVLRLGAVAGAVLVAEAAVPDGGWRCSPDGRGPSTGAHAPRTWTPAVRLHRGVHGALARRLSHLITGRPGTLPLRGRDLPGTAFWLGKRGARKRSSRLPTSACLGQSSDRPRDPCSLARALGLSLSERSLPAGRRGGGGWARQASAGKLQWKRQGGQRTGLARGCGRMRAPPQPRDPAWTRIKYACCTHRPAHAPVHSRVVAEVAGGCQRGARAAREHSPWRWCSNASSTAARGGE